jgi:hypothetical protein
MRAAASLETSDAGGRGCKQIGSVEFVEQVLTHVVIFECLQDESTSD